ncbi:MAG: hypothetical protein QOH42_2200, partial [Blastocatellia bacterium]|nr:hypothetical protein [Blastocatellia bacterium]
MKLFDKQRYLKPFVALVDAAAIGIIAFSLYRLDASHLDFRFLLVFLFSVVIGARLIIHIPSIKGELTVSDTSIFLAMLLWGGESAILLAAAVGFFSSMRVTSRAASHLFNFAVMTCSTFLTVVVLRLALGPVAMLGGRGLSVILVLVMATVQYVSNSALVTIYTGLKTRQPFWPTWRQYYLWASLTYLVGASAALLI